MSRDKCLKHMVECFKRASERRAECERRLAQLAGDHFDPARATQIVEWISKEAEKPEFRRRRLEELELSTQGGPLIRALLDAEAVLQVARSAHVRVRDLRSGRADKKFAQARGNRSWDEITYADLGRWEQQDVRQQTRRGLALSESKRSRQGEIRRAFEAVVSVIREVDGKVPGYTRDYNDGKVRVPMLPLLLTAVELLIGSPVSPRPETAVKWLQERRGKTFAPPWTRTSSWMPASSILEGISDAEREIMRADSARSLELLKELGKQIPTRAIVASDHNTISS